MAHASSLVVLSALILGACASADTSAPAATTSDTAPAGSSASRGDFIPEGAAPGGSSDLGREDEDARSTSLNTNTQSGTRGGEAPVDP